MRQDTAIAMHTYRRETWKNVSPQIAKVNGAGVGANSLKRRPSVRHYARTRMGWSAYEPPCGVVLGRKRLTLSALTMVAT